MCFVGACLPIRSVKRSVATHADKCHDKQRRESKTVKHFVEHIHDDPFASLDYVPVYKSIIYVTMRIAKAPIKLSRRKTPKTQQVEGFPHPRKNSYFIAGTGRGVTFAPTIILLV